MRGLEDLLNPMEVGTLTKLLSIDLTGSEHYECRKRIFHFQVDTDEPRSTKLSSFLHYKQFITYTSNAVISQAVQ